MNKITLRVRRILALIPYLKKRGTVALSEAAADLNCSSADLVRDVKWILMCGVPPYLPDDYIGVYVNRGQIEIGFAGEFDRPVALSVSEALGVKIILETLAGSGKGQQSEAAAGLLAKIEKRLAGAGLRDPSRRFSMGSASSEVRETLGDLRMAIDQRRVLEIDYYSASSDLLSSRRVRPYGLVHHLDGHYLVAHCETRGAVLSFRVDRIRDLRPTEEVFKRPADFQLSRFRKRRIFFPTGKGQMVRVRFSSKIAAEAMRTCAAESTAWKKDGSCVAVLAVEKPSWFLSWVLGFGIDAQILGPKSMIRLFLDQIRRYRAGLC